MAETVATGRRPHKVGPSGGQAPKVSVLIPAFRASYLGQAIASVLTQGFEDYELLIGDDSLAGEVAAVVQRFDDPRIRYSRTAGAQGAAENIRLLWNAAQCDLVKFLFDDDILLPNALVDLMAPLDKVPEAAFIFGHRDFVDEMGRTKSEPRLLTAGATVRLSRRDLAGVMLPPIANRVGEYSNLLMNRASGISLDDMNTYAGFEIEMLVDVAFHLNASARAPAVGVGRTVTHYRKHAQQNSAAGFNPIFFKGLFEWELLLRGEFATGSLKPEQANQALDKLEVAYRAWRPTVPELEQLAAGHPALRAQIGAGDRDTLDAAFRARWDAAVAAARARAAAEPSRLQALRDAGVA